MEKCPDRRQHRAKEKKDKGCWCCRKLLAILFSQLGLCGLVLGYTVFGAYLFRYLEAPYEMQRASKVVSMRNFTVQKLWNITDKFNVLYKENWTALVSAEIAVFQQQLLAAVRDGYDGQETLPRSPNASPHHSPSHQATQQQQWTLSSAFLYSLTLITTIGKTNNLPRSRRLRLDTFLIDYRRAARLCINLNVRLAASSLCQPKPRRFLQTLNTLFTRQISGPFKLKCVISRTGEALFLYSDSADSLAHLLYAPIQSLLPS